MDSLSRDQEIGERIRRARLAMNMSQQELSTKANISLPHISEKERRNRILKISVTTQPPRSTEKEKVELGNR